VRVAPQPDPRTREGSTQGLKEFRAFGRSPSRGFNNGKESYVYVVEILTPEGWARAPETEGKTLTEREALDVARLCYGVKLVALFRRKRKGPSD
jgi:hypothetical protein